MLEQVRRTQFRQQLIRHSILEESRISRVLFIVRESSEEKFSAVRSLDFVEVVSWTYEMRVVDDSRFHVTDKPFAMIGIRASDISFESKHLKCGTL